MLEIIKEFLIFYDMHYTLSIFQRYNNNNNYNSESNLKEDINREELSKKLNIDSSDVSKPLLHQTMFNTKVNSNRVIQKSDQRTDELNKKE